MKIFETLDIAEHCEVFVVGTIRGSYESLISKLDKIGFNYDKDLLISVGNTVDRKERSVDCMRLIGKHWFKSTLGNHEDFCISGLSDPQVAALQQCPHNGIQWFYQLPKEVKAHLAKRMLEMPVLLEIAYRNKKFGFVHADVPIGDWDILKSMAIDGDVIDNKCVIALCLWGGEVDYNPDVHVKNIERVFMGRTIPKDTKNASNCTFMNVGAEISSAQDQSKLSIVKLSSYC